MEVAKLKRTLEAKNKEMDELRDSNAKLKTDLHKLKESTDQNRREKAELRMKQLSSVTYVQYSCYSFEISVSINKVYNVKLAQLTSVKLHCIKHRTGIIEANH